VEAETFADRGERGAMKNVATAVGVILKVFERNVTKNLFQGLEYLCADYLAG
jgi:hypothetical protein